MTKPLAAVPMPDQAVDQAAWSTRMDSSLAAADERMAQGDAAQLRGSGSGASAPGVNPQELAKLRQVSQDFESLFLSYMLKVGREAGIKGTLMGHSQGEEIFTEMRDDELAKHMAKAGGIGLANLLVEQLTRTLQDQARRTGQAAAAAADQNS